MESTLFSKIADRIAILIVNIIIIISTAVGPALILASSPHYYQRQFEKNELYSYTNEDGKTVLRPIRYLGGDAEKTANFTDEQLDAIAQHIIDYLFGGGETFALTMDNVFVNGERSDGVEIFGEEAVTHMEDVRDLMQLGKWASIISLILLPFLVAYLIIRRRQCSDALVKYTAIFFGALLALLLGMCVFSLVQRGSFLSNFWETAHYLFFPFQPEKVQGSFFNDTLTMILTLDLFMDAVVIVLSSLAVSLTLWFAGIFLMRKKS